MKYEDNLAKGYVNGHFVGIRQGTNTQDRLEPEADGYETQRESVRFGTVMQDALEPNFPEPETTEEENGEEEEGEGE